MATKGGFKTKGFKLSFDAIYLIDDLSKKYEMKQNEFLHHLLKQQLQYAPPSKQDEHIKTMMKKLNEMEKDNKELRQQHSQENAGKIEGLIRANSKLENNISNLNEQIDSLHKLIGDIEAQAVIEIEELQENNQRLLRLLGQNPKLQLLELTEEMEKYRVRTVEAEQILKACLKERSALIADKEQLEKQNAKLVSELKIKEIEVQKSSAIMNMLVNDELSIEELKSRFNQIKNNKKGETA